MRVLSLFDGMACGMIAFKVAGIPIDSYDAYEIDKFAVQVATHNFPEIKEHGDVFKADFTEYEGVDYVIGGSPCFTAGHLILTDKGYVDVKDIKTGDMVLTHKGRYKPVIRTNERVSKVCEVKAMGYPTFTTTAEHPFYTLKRRKATYAEYKQLGSWRTFDKEPKWTAAKNLANNHFVGMHIDKTEGAQSIDCETAYILGRYVADGHLRKTKRTGRKNSYQYQVVLSIGAEKVKQFKKRVKYHHFSCYLHTDNVYRCVFSNQELLEFIRSNGFGEGAANKNIPEMIHGQMPKVKKAFLMGYIEGDGCYVAKEDKYSMSTVSPRLAFGLQRLITSLWQTNVSVSVSNNDKPHKIGDRDIKANYPLYTICAKREIRKQTVAHIQDGIMWTQVKSVRPTEREETVYNIEVADDNSYTVNNCIVHNCTYWSIAQSPDKRETTASGIGWELFSQYVRALNEAKPKYFIYENNKSMAKAIYNSISETFEFEPIMINSALVSAQNRQRLYWVGKRNADGTYSKVDVKQPEDRGILLKDILDGADLTNRNKSFAYTSRCQAAIPQDTIIKHRHTMVAEPVGTTKDGKSYCLTQGYSNGSGENIGNYVTHTLKKGCKSMVAEPVNVTAEGKAQCLRATCYKDGVRNIAGNDIDKKTGVAEPVCIASRGRYSDTDSRSSKTDAPTYQHYEARTDSKTNAITTVSKDNLIGEPVCMRYERSDKAKQLRKDYESGKIKRGYHEFSELHPRQDGKTNTLSTVKKDNPICEPVRVGLYPTSDGRLLNSQGMRIYSTDAKSVTQSAQGGGMGTKTGLYAIPIEFDGDIPIKAVSGADGKTYTVYEVRDGNITIKDRTYPIKLIDGYYIIRKLTVSECKRLQTVPDWYDMTCISNSQAYKCIGNGWTIEVIAHLIRATQEGKTEAKQLTFWEV